MQFGDALNKAKDLASENSEQVDSAIDAASEKIQEKTPDQVDGYVEKGADELRGKLGL